MLLALTMVFSLLPGVTAAEAATGSSDTYANHTYTGGLGNMWSPHTWTTSEESAVLNYLQMPLVDLVKYGCDETVASQGYVYEISLREGVVWQDGTEINADTYIYSMQQLLDPKMQNYRADNCRPGSFPSETATMAAKMPMTTGNARAAATDKKSPAGWIPAGFRLSKKSIQMKWVSDLLCTQRPSCVKGAVTRTE